MTTSPSIATIAGEVATADEFVLKMFPYISTVIGFIPGAQVAVPFMPLVGELLTALDNAAKAVASGNTSAAFDVVIKEVVDHLTPGAANSPALSPAPAGEAVPPMPPAPSGS